MAKYSPKAQQEVEKAMHEYKEGESSHIENPKQAVAVGLSKARKKGAKVPPKKKS